MSYCLNTDCKKNQNARDNKFCINCGSKLLLKDLYRASDPLGKGGFGKTFRAVNEGRFNEPCVIKQFSPGPQIKGNAWALKKAIELFHQEAKRLYELGKHEQIPEMISYFEQDKCLYLVQELIEGQNLLKELEQEGAFSENQIWQVLADMLSVLKFIHENNVIHRDIKPENIIRRQSDRKLVLIDFGISKQATGNMVIGAGNTIIGTPGYSPEEQFMRGEAYPASDLYALGATCIHLLTKKPPQKLYNTLKGGWLWRDELLQTGASISNKLEQVLDKLLKEVVSERYQSAEEVLRDLNATTALQPVPSTVLPPGLPTEPQSKTWQCVHTLTGHAASVRSLAISRDAQTLATGSDDNTIKLWHLNSGSLIKTLTVRSGFRPREATWFTSVAISPDGQTLASGCLDNSIKVWDWSSDKLIHNLKKHSDSVYAIAICPDGQTLVSGSRDNTIKAWNLPTGKLIRNITGHSNSVNAVAICPDGQTLVSGSRDNTIKVWNLLNGKLLRTFTGHLDWVRAVAISPDGSTLASGSNDKTIQLWHLGSGTMIRTLTRHSDWVTAVAISPDGNTLVSGSRDKTINLWQLGSGQLICTLTGHLESVCSIAISPQGNIFASSSEDGAIKIWRRD